MFSRYWLFVIAVGGLLTVSVGGSVALSKDTADQPKSTKHSQAAKDGENKTTPSPTPISVEQKSSPSNVEGDRERDQEYYSREDLTAQQSMAYSTKELVRLADNQNIITIAESTLLAITIFFTAWAALAASRAARAADAAVEITEDTARHQLRAYVYVEAAHVIDFNRPFEVRVKIKNFGQTPAYGLSQWVTTGFFKFPLRELPKIPPPPDNIPIHDLAPGDHIAATAAHPRQFDNAEIESMRVGENAFFVYGKITFMDAFDTPQTTEYCLFTGGAIGLSERLALYGEGNKST